MSRRTLEQILTVRLSISSLIIAGLCTSRDATLLIDVFHIYVFELSFYNNLM